MHGETLKLKKKKKLTHIV